MPEFLALEWSSREIRVAVASGRGQRAVIDHAFAVPWSDDESAAESREQRIGQRIAAELDARGIAHHPALVAVGRTSIELRQLQLPPAPDADLPDMVRFQASREFNELDENWLLDFVPIDQGADAPRTVLATAIAPAVIRQIEGVCDAAGLKMQRLLLRPCAAASLLTRNRTGKPGQYRLLVDLLADESELTVVVDGKAVFLRTTRLASDPPPLPALLAEIRLTMAAVQNQLAGNKVGGVLLSGHGAMEAELAKSIEAELGMPAELSDPFDRLELGPALRKAMPERPGRFAALLGMLLAEIQGTGHAIDFLHPRRRAETPSRRKQWIIAATAAALLPLGYLIYSRVGNYQLSSEVSRLSAESTQLERRLTAAKKTHATVAEINKLTSGETNWLDKLYALSEGFPPVRDAVLGQITFGIRQGKGQVEMEGWVRDADVIGKMEERVRARAGQVHSKRTYEDHSVKNYSWKFEATVSPKQETKP